MDIRPPHEPFDTRRLAVDARHTLYIEQSGDPGGLPALFLHGGPGSGCNADQRGLFDRSLFRAVLFDQRGAGRSTPKRELAGNTTQALISDIERIREELGIARWMVVGGSWGATLALAYAEAYPHRVLGLVMRAVFLGTHEEFHWAFEGAARTFFPELWRALCALLPEDERARPVEALGRRLMDADPRVHGPAAKVWHDYERALSVLRPSSLILPRSLAEMPAGDLPNTPFMEWHYLSNECFLAPGQLLEEAYCLSGIPGIIVQGRYDLLCPPQSAYDLCAAWRDCELRFVPGAGHAASEPAIRDALVAAITEMGQRLVAAPR